MKTTLLKKYVVTSVIGLGFLTTLLYTRVQITNNKQVIPTPTPTVSATSTPTVKGATTKKIQAVNSDPIIDCVSSHPNCNNESLRLKSSQCSNIFCCGFGDGRWELYPSEEKCKQAWAAQSPSNTINTNVPSYTYPTYTPTTYYSCTLCYSFGCTTYSNLTKTKAECDARQANIDAIGENSYNSPTPQPTIDVGAYNALVMQCQRSVVVKYDPLIKGCNIQFGASSATEACETIYEQNRQKEYNACGQML